MKKYRVDVQGMTCTGCEEHVVVALEAIGAKEIQADFRKGEAVFELPENMEVQKAQKAIADAKYQPGKQKKSEPKKHSARMKKASMTTSSSVPGALPFLPPSKP